MRPSISARRQVFRAYETVGRRNISNGSTRTSPRAPFVCESCRARIAFPTPPQRVQRRWNSASSTAAAESDEAVKANPIPQTHYEFFPQTLASGPPPEGRFPIDPRQLRKEFLQLQAVAHPDRHPPHLKTRAEATSARINEAYKTLQNPLLRAQYLLSLRGIDVAEDETAKVEDPELLMEVLDTREEIENAQEEEDLDDMKRVNDGRIGVSENVLDQAFRDDDMQKAKEEAVRLRYWVNIKESLDAWEKGKPVVLVH